MFPLSAVFRYSFGLPDKTTNMPGKVLMTARNGAPLIVWQSVQLQIVVVSGSASASIVTYPQWQPPSIFIALALRSLCTNACDDAHLTILGIIGAGWLPPGSVQQRSI